MFKDVLGLTNKENDRNKRPDLEGILYSCDDGIIKYFDL